MGLLDDAIREHLDLKRRRGADPTEVARLEHEALGPVRREAAPAEPADEHHEHEHEHGEHPSEPELATAEPHADDRTHVLAPEDRHEPPHGDPLRERHPPELGGAAAPEPADAEPTEPARSGAESANEAPDPRLSDVVHQPTTEFRVEDHHDEHEHDEHDPSGPASAPEPASGPAGPDEDVLEETPEFLQETPEHDRLWFEQRPPRDFDFDG